MRKQTATKPKRAAAAKTPQKRGGYVRQRMSAHGAKQAPRQAEPQPLPEFVMDPVTQAMVPVQFLTQLEKMRNGEALAGELWRAGRKDQFGDTLPTDNQLDPGKRVRREVLEEVFERIGGIPAMTRWANYWPTEFYRLFGKYVSAKVLKGLAVEATGQNAGSVVVQISKEEAQL
jgi:hypothetical protein